MLQNWTISLGCQICFLGRSSKLVATFWTLLLIHNVKPISSSRLNNKWPRFAREDWVFIQISLTWTRQLSRFWQKTKKKRQVVYSKRIQSLVQRMNLLLNKWQSNFLQRQRPNRRKMRSWRRSVMPSFLKRENSKLRSLLNREAKVCLLAFNALRPSTYKKLVYQEWLSLSANKMTLTIVVLR